MSNETISSNFLYIRWNEVEVKELQRELNDFVRKKYNNGIIVTSTKLTDALRKFGNNFMVNNFLKR